MHRQYTLMNDGIIKCSERPGVGVSCTWEGWHPPFYLRIGHYTEYDAYGGFTIPPWYYGLSYIEDYGRIFVFHLIPINLVVRALRWAHYAWARLRCRRSYFDAQIMAARDKGFWEGREFEQRHSKSSKASS